MPADTFRAALATDLIDAVMGIVVAERSGHDGGCCMRRDQAIDCFLLHLDAYIAVKIEEALKDREDSLERRHE